MTVAQARILIQKAADSQDSIVTAPSADVMAQAAADFGVHQKAKATA